MNDDLDPILVAGDEGEVLDDPTGDLGDSDEQRCRNGARNCAGPAAFDLSCEFPVPLCGACRREAAGERPRGGH